jgi:hypothetical protein
MTEKNAQQKKSVNWTWVCLGLLAAWNLVLTTQLNDAANQARSAEGIAEEAYELARTAKAMAGANER